MLAILGERGIRATFFFTFGPDRSGVSKETGLPLEWSDTKNIVWKVPLPGPGSSSPIVFGDHVYVTCYSGYGLENKDSRKQEDLRRHLVCVDEKTGNMLWAKEFEALVPEHHDAVIKVRLFDPGEGLLVQRFGQVQAHDLGKKRFAQPADLEVL